MARPYKKMVKELFGVFPFNGGGGKQETLSGVNYKILGSVDVLNSLFKPNTF